MSPESWSAILTALASVESLPPDVSGLVAFGAGASGMLVENRRVCWVVADGLQRRLTDLLTEQASLQGLDLDEVYAHARSQSKPVGQMLVQSGLLSPGALDGVLRRHSAESLSALAETSAHVEWRPRSGAGYSPRFTYLPEEVLFDVVDLEFPDERTRAAAELLRFAAPEILGVTFVLDAQAELSVPIARTGHIESIEALLEIGRRARTLYRAARELEEVPGYMLATLDSGGMMAVWWEDGLLYALCSEERTAIARVTARWFAERPA